LLIVKSFLNTLMSTTVLPQLQIIEAELAAQEDQLNAELAALQEKLRGIRAVMPMFSGTAAAAAPTAPTASAPKTAANKKAAAVASKSVAKDKRKAPQKAAKSKAPKKADGRAADWQKYTRPGVKNQSMPDAVRLILETQSEKNFTIAEVMDALFKENMPKAQHLKARNRISNVLSGGVRAGDWYKGARGTYRMTA
jgi:hypothetical protein